MGKTEGSIMNMSFGIGTRRVKQRQNKWKMKSGSAMARRLVAMARRPVAKARRPVAKARRPVTSLPEQGAGPTSVEVVTVPPP